MGEILICLFTINTKSNCESISRKAAKLAKKYKDRVLRKAVFG